MSKQLIFAEVHCLKEHFDMECRELPPLSLGVCLASQAFVIQGIPASQAKMGQGTIIDHCTTVKLRYNQLRSGYRQS